MNQMCLAKTLTARDHGNAQFLAKQTVYNPDEPQKEIFIWVHNGTE
jgi:hypothetical protein